MEYFNKGWMCKSCGPVKESKQRSINKVKYDCCKVCDGVVKRWGRPFTERAGRCTNCGESSFKLAIVKHKIIRCCKNCNEVYNIEDKKLLRKGEEAKRYERE